MKKKMALLLLATSFVFLLLGPGQVAVTKSFSTTYTQHGG
jgi:hypothetical protein